MYTEQEIRVRRGSSVTTTSHVSNGVKQGGVLSPFFFHSVHRRTPRAPGLPGGDDGWVPYQASLLRRPGIC
jgi:hypothetical protein